MVAMSRRKRVLGAVLGGGVGFLVAGLIAGLTVPDGFGGIGLAIVMVVGVIPALTIAGAVVGWRVTAKS